MPNPNEDDPGAGRAQDTAEDWNAYANAPMNSPEVHELLDEPVNQADVIVLKESIDGTIVDKMSKAQRKKHNSSQKKAKIE